MSALRGRDERAGAAENAVESRDDEQILVRLSAELSTKARGTRKRFTRRLVENIRAAFRSVGVDAHVEDRWMRLLVHVPRPGLADVLTRVPGISSFSVVEARAPAVLDRIVEEGTRLFADRVRGRSYAVRARRAGTHPFTSKDIQMRLGAALNADARVDLSDPEVEVDVEVRDEGTFFFSGRTRGLGGLPLGVEGRAVCLLSGGFDSAAAAWLMLKRGVHLDYVFCNLAGGAYERSVLEVAKIVADSWSYGSRPRLYAIDFGPAVDDLRSAAQPRYWQLLLKRLMYRAASRIAGQVGADAVVTGEAIGQVSSQTLANLRALEGASAVPVFRPLLGFDKSEIIELTRRVGTYDLSAKVKEYCAIAPGSPVTNATSRATEREEAKLDLSILDAAVTDGRVIDLLRVNSADLVQGYLFTDRVPGDAVVVDLRSEDEWEAWHYPGALRRDPWQLEERHGLDADRSYVLYCDAGMQAAVVAEQLQRDGVEAYAYRGGTGALRKEVEGSAAP